MTHGHLAGQLTHQPLKFCWGSKLENWTTEFVQRTTGKSRARAFIGMRITSSWALSVTMH